MIQSTRGGWLRGSLKAWVGCGLGLWLGFAQAQDYPSKPITLIVGFAIMLLSLPILIPQFTQALETGFGAVHDLLTKVP